ncbi:MAG: sugar phosphate isomerase/epimerase [Clostridia bacterium]|nr:sugar phosphate isomerase/epimerase [Clostridia bacterium]
MIFTNYTQFYRDRDERGMEYAAAHTKALGFDGVEYYGRAQSELWRDAKNDRQILDHEGLTVSCYSVGVRLYTDDRKTVEEQMARHIEAAAILGSPYLHHTLYPTYSKESLHTDSYRRVLDAIVDLAERIANRCGKYGVTCLYEPQGIYFNGVEGLAQIYGELKTRGCPVGICGDFGNSFFVDVDPRAVFERFASDIRHVHVKDYLLTDAILPDRKAYESMSGKRIYEVALGEGSVDFAHGFRTLRTVGYNGAVSFEFDGSDEELRRSIAWLKNLIVL